MSDFNATSGLAGSLATKRTNFTVAEGNMEEVAAKAKYRTEMSNATWVPRQEREEAESEVRFLTKTAWHIGHGYTVGVGMAEQHGFSTLSTNAGRAPPRIYEYAGLTVKQYTKSSGPYMKDQQQEGRIEGMLMSKKERHDKLIEESEHRIRLINESLEPMVVESVRSVRERLSENEVQIESLFMQLADEHLSKIDMAQLQGVWADYQEQSKLRESWISEFDEQTDQLEVQRAALVQNELKTLGIVLLDVAHTLPGPIERYLEEEALKENVLLLNNRRAYADMLRRLRTREIELDLKARKRWEERKHAWYLTLHDRAVAKCRATLASKEYKLPKKRDTLFGALRSQQTILFERRINMWSDVQELTPPSLTVEKAKAWGENLHELDKEQELEHKQRCGAIRKFENEHYETSRQVIERMKTELKGYAEMTDAEMPTEEELADAAAEFEALILERRDLGLEAVSQVSQTLAKQLDYLRTPGEDLEKLLNVVAEMKEDYHIRVDKARDEHAEAMAKSRQENIDNDTKLEDEFEFLVTTMRQDGSIENLQANLPLALAALDQVKAEYRRYYDLSMNLTKEYNNGVRTMLDNIDDDMLKMLGLSREEVEQPAEEPKEDEAPAGEDSEEGKVETVTYDDEEKFEGEEYDYVTTKSGAKKHVADRRHPEHAHDLVGIMVIPHMPPPPEKPEGEGDEDEEGAEGEGEAAEAEAEPEAEEEGEEEEEEDELDENGEPVLDEEGNPKKKPRKPKFVPDAMVSPLNPFSQWGNEPLIEVLELPVETLLAVRRAQRRQLLEYKEEQDGIATEDMETIVRDEQEQLVEQLDERIRQWAPRPGRAEMDVYEVRDTQLHQHMSRTDRHVGAFSVRASVQQSHFSSLYSAAETELKRHVAAQKARVASLAFASNTSQLGNYQRLAKQESTSFVEAVAERSQGIEAYAAECMAGLRKMNKQFLDSCYIFPDLGGTRPDGQYNPDEVQVFKERLDELDIDVVERADVWVKHAREQAEKHDERSKVALEEFHAAIKDVETDIMLLEAVDKQVRTCSLLTLQEQNSNDAAMDAIDEKLNLLETLCEGVPLSTMAIKGNQVDEEAEAILHGKPLSIRILQCLLSIRWRVHARAKYLDCLQSTAIELGPVSCVAPLAPEQAAPPPPEMLAPPDEDEGGEPKPNESSTLAALRSRIWPEPKEEAEGGDASAAGEGDQGDEQSAGKSEWEKVLERYPMLEQDDKEQYPETNFMEALSSIHERQKEALHSLVEEYYSNLGDREITRKQGDPACTATRYIPAGLEEFDEKNEKTLEELHVGAVEYLKNKVRQFRSQIAKLSSTMPKVAAAVMADVADRARKREFRSIKAIADGFEDAAHEWGLRREENNSNLKPSLGNENARDELEALCDRERARHEEALKVTETALIDALQVLSVESWSFYNEILHDVTALLSLFDTVVQPADLVPTEEDVVAKRKTLTTLLKEYVSIEAVGEKEPPPEGKAFHTKEWKGVKEGKLCAAAVFSVLKAVEQDSGAGAPAVLAAIDQGVTDKLESNDTPNHAHIIKSRDRTLHQMLTHFAAEVENTIRHYSAIKREEQRWCQNWNSLVVSLKEN